MVLAGGAAITIATNNVTIDCNGFKLGGLSAGPSTFANGIQASELCPELPIEPKKGHLLITDRYPATVTHTLVELGYVTSAHNAKGPSTACNIQPRSTGQLFIGASRQFGTTDPQVEGWMLAKMLKRAAEYMPGLARLNGIRAWAGFRAATPDGMPLIGELPGQPGLYAFTGLGSRGLVWSPLGAEILAARLCGDPIPVENELASAIDPRRFLLEN